MKKVLLTLAFLLAVIPSLFAQDGRSIVRVRMSDNSPLRIAIDNKTYNDEGKVVTVDNITAGRHRLKVFVPSTSGRGRRTLVYEGDFKASVGMYSLITVDRVKGKVRITTGYRSNLDKDTRNNNGRNDRSDDKDGRYSDRDDREWRNRDDDGYNAGRNAFSSRDMEDLQDRVEGRMHNDDKVKLMKSVLNNRTYTTDQVRTMLSWLSFDDSKLDFAKWAYENVADKRNYWKLEDSFSFSSSKEEFSDYITAKR